MQSGERVQEMLAAWARLKQLDAEEGIRYSIDYMEGSKEPTRIFQSNEAAASKGALTELEVQYISDSAWHRYLLHNIGKSTDANGPHSESLLPCKVVTVKSHVPISQLSHRG